MRLLLDTCAFLWLANDDPALSPVALAALTTAENDLFLSSLSAAEIAIKYGLGRLELSRSPDQLIPIVRQRYAIAKLALRESAALALAQLPNLHQDPFDRLLIAQALTVGLVLVTPDPLIRRYPVPTLW